MVEGFGAGGSRGTQAKREFFLQIYNVHHPNSLFFVLTVFSPVHSYTCSDETLKQKSERLPRL